MESATGSNSWYNANNTNATNLANAFANLNQIISAIASASGSAVNKITILSLIWGSLIVSTVV